MQAATFTRTSVIPAASSEPAANPQPIHGFPSHPTTFKQSLWLAPRAQRSDSSRGAEMQTGIAMTAALRGKHRNGTPNSGLVMRTMESGSSS